MSNDQQAKPQPLVSPVAYISGQFEEACQDISANPQEVFQMLLFSFVSMKPENRGKFFRNLRTSFNKFAEVVDLVALEKQITDAVATAELQLHDSLMDNFWNSDSAPDDAPGLSLV